MARIKPQALLQQSKKKKGPSRISATTVILYSLIVVVMLFFLFTTYRHWSQRSRIQTDDRLSSFEGDNTIADVKKSDVPRYAVLKTSKGLITVELYKEGSPEVVDEFIDLCQRGHFKGMPFHHVIKNFVIQGGNSDQPGATEDWTLRGKHSSQLDTSVKHEAFMLGTSKAKHDKEAFELFITTAPIPDLNEKVIVFGRVIGGEDVVQLKTTEMDSRPEYQPGIFDDLFLNLFRSRMVQEVGWDSEKPGYNGLIEVANRLMIRRSNSETKEAAVRILRSLFPPFLLELYRMLISPIQGGKLAAMMVARVTALSCQWLMGHCAVNSVDLPDGSSLRSGVFVERCKYLEESKCVGICINTCKLPTQTFFRDYMGVPLLMEPNFSDYSCQFKFGVLPLPAEDDSALKEPCLEICPNASRRRGREFTSNAADVLQCPKA